jgi:hypothetical protein
VQYKRIRFEICSVQGEQYLTRLAYERHAIMQAGVKTNCLNTCYFCQHFVSMASAQASACSVTRTYKKSTNSEHTGHLNNTCCIIHRLVAQDRKGVTMLLFMNLFLFKSLQLNTWKNLDITAFQRHRGRHLINKWRLRIELRAYFPQSMLHIQNINTFIGLYNLHYLFFGRRVDISNIKSAFDK